MANTKQPENAFDKFIAPAARVTAVGAMIFFIVQCYYVGQETPEPQLKGDGLAAGVVEQKTGSGNELDLEKLGADLRLTETEKKPSHQVYMPAAPRTVDDSEQASEELWYVGGTLHDKMGDAWVTAGYQNRLATASDFAYTAYQTRDRMKAAEVVLCMDEALSEPVADTTRRTQSVRGLATMCILLLE